MRPIYVVCFSTLGLLLYTALFFFFYLWLCWGRVVIWDLHKAAWDTVVWFNWPQWHWATTETTVYTSIPSLLSPCCPKSSGTGLFHLDYTRKHFPVNRRSLCVDLFGTVDMTAFTSFTQRSPVTEKLNAKKKKKKKKESRVGTWFYSSGVDLILGCERLKNECEPAVDCGGTG